MDEDATTNQTKWSLVEVEGPLEKFPHTNPWIEHGLMEKIEGEFSLWQKKVPKVRGKCSVNAGKNCKEVVLECGNSMFSSVLAIMSGGTSWIFAFHLKVIASLYAVLASLSKIWRSTERPRAARHVITAL